jgi:glycosyltransferase involved in cell wall biosynthesis
VHPWLRLADEIVVPPVYLRDVFAQHGYRTRMIRNVVDTSCFAYRERDSSSARLLSARNLERYYRVDTIIEAFALIQRNYSRATLTIGGSGRDEHRRRRLAATVSADVIRFVGRVEPAAMPALYDACDVFVNASEVDNQPLSILEAFASGLAVVSTPTGDIESMVGDCERGLLVPPDDPAVLAKAVIRLLEDPSLARNLARAARAEVEQYTWPRCREHWRTVYRGEAAA